VRVLDVGCGAGQTVRLLEPDRPVSLFGIDVDLAALLPGARLAEVEGIELSLACAPATAIPCQDGAFDLVISRVALDYMQQRSALTEMTRALRVNGLLFCRVERIWYDLAILIERGPRRSIRGSLSACYNASSSCDATLVGTVPAI
jgi:ubiquinone/menaquinone biosynthesis C-methylase UbiE